MPRDKVSLTPLEACSDPNFCCENSSGITGAKWCDSVVFTKKGLSVERIAFDHQYWHDLERKLLLYYYEHLIDFAAAEML